MESVIEIIDLLSQIKTVLQVASKRIQERLCQECVVRATFPECEVKYYPTLKEYEKEYLKDAYADSTHKLGDTILKLISAQRRETCQHMIETINFSKNSQNLGLFLSTAGGRFFFIYLVPKPGNNLLSIVWEADTLSWPLSTHLEAEFPFISDLCH